MSCKSGKGAIRNADIFVLIISDAYMKSMYCTAEYSAALNKNISEKIKLIPIRVTDTVPSGILSSILYLDLYGSNEKEAEHRILSAFGKCEFTRSSPEYPGIARFDNKEYPGSMPVNNLPPRNPYFSGRIEILDKIHANFQSENTVSLNQTIVGMGGIGKTQTALEYAYRYAHNYDCIWWVPSETEESALNSYKSFAEKMNLLEEGQQQENEFIIETVLNWMDSHDKCLFIYDNADSNDVDRWISRYLPKSKLSHSLITTRNQYFPESKSVNIDIFTKDEARKFLLSRTKTDDDHEVTSKLIERLGYLPLALEHAAAYMVNLKISYDEYLSLIDNCGLEPSEGSDGSNNNIRFIMPAFEISINGTIMPEAARQLLNLCAFMAPNKIPMSLLVRNRDLLPEPLLSNLNEEININRLCVELRRFSLITGSSQEFNIHPLLQEYLRYSQEDNSKWIDICLRVFLSDIPRDYDTWESKEIFVHISEHAFSVVNYAYSYYENQKSKGQSISELFFYLGYGFNKVGQYDKALECYHKTLEIREKVLDVEHLDTAMTYNNIANVYKKQGCYQTALEWLQKALNVSLRILGESHPSISKTYNNIASVYSRLHEYAEALEWLHKALLICEKVLGKEHPDTATTYNNIAGVYANQENYTNALKWYHKALIIDEKVLGKEHPDTATTYNNIAFIYSKQKDYSKALELYSKALAIREMVMGNKHPDTAITYNNIAFVYFNQGDYHMALEWFHKALEICEQVLGTEHPDTALAYNNIALAFSNQGDFDKAREWFHKALSINEKVLGKDHPYTVRTYSNIEALEGLLSSSGNSSNGLTIAPINIPPTFFDFPANPIGNIPDAEISEFCAWYVSLVSDNKENTDAEFRIFLTELQASIKRIKEDSEFSIDDENAPELCQYTKLNTLKFLVKAETEGDNVPIPKFRLSNVAYLNDPSEGQVFIDLLNHYSASPIFDELFGISLENNAQPLAELHLNDVYIGSFSTSKNKLPLWTLYGDNSNGCCIVFDNSFFVSPRSKVDLSIPKEFEQDIKLYRVHYYNTKKLDRVDDNIMRSLRVIATSITQWKKIIMQNPKLLRWIVSRLNEIRFLFKCDDYSYEDEVRLILRDDIVNKPFVDRVTDVPRLFINVNNPVALKEVIFGAKVENPSAPAQFLLFSGVKKVTLSGITFI